MRIHLIYAAERIKNLNASSKMNVDWDFFLFLKNIGRETASRWLEEQWDNIGVKSTVNIREKFLCGPKNDSYNGDLSEKHQLGKMFKVSNKNPEQHSQKKIKQRK